MSRGSIHAVSVQGLQPRDRSRQRAKTCGQEIKTLANHRHSLPLHGARSECDGAEHNRHRKEPTKNTQPQRGKIDFPKLTDLDTRLADMDRDGIDVQVISPYPRHFVYAAPPEVARDSCHMVNDHIAGMVARHPGRLMGIGTVPLQDPGMAVTELNRTVKELGFRGV